VVSLETTASKVIYNGNGSTKVFAFAFKVWKSDQIKVFLSEKGGVESDVTSQVSVALTATGGTVTFGTAPATGTTLAILRSMPFVQEDVYITGTRFDPHEIEEALDIATAERQELKEQVDRCVQAPATMQGGSKVYYERIVAATARAEAAASSAQLTLRQVQAEKLKVEQAGDEQVERVAGMGDMAGLSMGVACGEQTWTLEKDVAVGDRIELPNELGYIPGRHHLLMSYDGVTMSQTWFAEVPASGDPYGVSHSIITKMPFRAGQELHAWVSPLGLADVPELVERVAELEAVLSTSGVQDLVSRVSGLEDALADLSRRVVYSEPEN
jgi:hypothetical protein